MEELLGPFSELLGERIVEIVQEPGLLQNFDDCGQHYDYDDGFEQFSPWEDVFGSRQGTQTILQAPLTLSTSTQVVEVIDERGENGIGDFSQNDFVGASTSGYGEICAYCSKSGKLSRCTRCKTAYYCSEDHQAAHHHIHEASCRKTATMDGIFNPQLLDCAHSLNTVDIDPTNYDLPNEILELLNVFQLVSENTSVTERLRLLKKCKSMCEQLNQRRNPLPQVTAMLEQAKILMQMYDNKEAETRVGRSHTASSVVNEDSTSGRSFHDTLKADVKEALDRVDSEAIESGLSKDPDGGVEVDGVFMCKGMCYCKTHTELEECSECGVDYRLLNQVRRTATNGDEVDNILIKEQQRLEELERQGVVPPHPDAGLQEEPAQIHHHQDIEDFQSIAKDLNEELARAREKDEADFMKSFASFQISEDRKIEL